MAWKRMVLEIGMGTDIRGGDCTKAAVRALRDALWHNSLTIGNAVGQDTDDMRVEVTVAVPEPETVDTDQVLAILPHGTGTCRAVKGGLSIPKAGSSDVTLLAHAAAVVYMNVPD
ncbi:MAG: Lin0512 family protein [Alphaproteobacteria bacterium]